MPLPVIDPAKYPSLLADKRQWAAETFARFGVTDVEVFESPKSHYRMRAEFRVWHEGDDLYYVMFEPGNKNLPVRIDECPMVAKPIEDVMFRLLDEIRDIRELRYRLFQVDFLSTLSGDVLVSMLYHRAIGDEWTEQVKALGEKLGIKLIGRSRKNKIVLDEDFVLETLNINGREYTYKQTENSFTQPNAAVCCHMIEWALDVTQNSSGDLVEFYCGNGNFTLPLAQNYRRVVATEISKESVRSAHLNIERNGIDNIDVLRMSSEDFSAVLTGEKETRKVAGLELESCEFSTVFVDPPRAGLDPKTIAQVQQYDNILYISCNPLTLEENLTALCETHEVQRFAIFDQFPYTDHLECGVYLKRRG